MIAVAVIDPSSTYRHNLHRLLRSFDAPSEGFESGEGYMASAIFGKEHVALISLGLPDIDGADLIRIAKEQSGASAVFAVVDEASVPVTVKAMRAGAADVFLKPPPLEPILRASRQGAAFSIAAGDNHGEPPAGKPLSKREREVLDLLLAGKTSREIAEKLGISIRTAEAHRKNIYSKTGVRSQAELARKLNC